MVRPLAMDPGVLGEERVVVADHGAAVAEVVNADEAVRACALGHI